MAADTLDKKVNEHVDFVRAKKNAAPKQIAVSATAAVEEPTQESVERQLKQLFSDPKTTDMPWLISVKSGIKALDKFNHDLGLQYQEKFITLMPQERRFVKP